MTRIYRTPIRHQYVPHSQKRFRAPLARGTPLNSPCFQCIAPLTRSRHRYSKERVCPKLSAKITITCYYRLLWVWLSKARLRTHKTDMGVAQKRRDQ